MRSNTRSHGTSRPRLAAVLLAAAVLAIAATACSSSGSPATVSSGRPSSGSAASSSSTAASSATAAADEPLTIVVTNDDGIDSPGIDVLATALRKLPNVTVVVVAPATNQSATGDKSTPGTVAYAPATTRSGIKGYAVQGHPADTVNVALDQLHLKPNLVASGVNRGQNVGPLAAISGTVGAALTAVRRHVPAVAGSAGLTEDADYAAAAQLMVEWITKNRAQLAAGTMPTDAVVNFNVPQCTSGSHRELLQVQPATEIPNGLNPFTANCAAPAPATPPTDDVHAIAEGYEAETKVPATQR